MLQRFGFLLLSSDAHSWKLTFTGLHALEPRVIKVGVARISAFLEPSAISSATAALVFAGFLDSATLGTLFVFCHSFYGR